MKSKEMISLMGREEELIPNFTPNNNNPFQVEVMSKLKYQNNKTKKSPIIKIPERDSSRTIFRPLRGQLKEFGNLSTNRIREGHGNIKYSGYGFAPTTKLRPINTNNIKNHIGFNYFPPLNPLKVKYEKGVIDMESRDKLSSSNKLKDRGNKIKENVKLEGNIRNLGKIYRSESPFSNKNEVHSIIGTEMSEISEIIKDSNHIRELSKDDSGYRKLESSRETNTTAIFVGKNSRENISGRKMKKDSTINNILKDENKEEGRKERNYSLEGEESTERSGHNSMKNAFNRAFKAQRLCDRAMKMLKGQNKEQKMLNSQENNSGIMTPDYSTSRYIDGNRTPRRLGEALKKVKNAQRNNTFDKLRKVPHYSKLSYGRSVSPTVNIRTTLAGLIKNSPSNPQNIKRNKLILLGSDEGKKVDTTHNISTEILLKSSDVYTIYIYYSILQRMM